MKPEVLSIQWSGRRSNRRLQRNNSLSPNNPLLSLVNSGVVTCSAVYISLTQILRTPVSPVSSLFSLELCQLVAGRTRKANWPESWCQSQTQRAKHRRGGCVGAGEKVRGLRLVDIMGCPCLDIIQLCLLQRCHFTLFYALKGNAACRRFCFMTYISNTVRYSSCYLCTDCSLMMMMNRLAHKHTSSAPANFNLSTGHCKKH